MCTREEVKQLLDENNLINDKKLFDLREQLFAHTQKLMEHPRSSTETTDQLAKINQTCSVRGTEIALMGQMIKELRHKQNTFEIKIDMVLEKLDNKYAPMAAWTVLKWAGAILGSAALMQIFTTVFTKN